MTSIFISMFVFSLIGAISPGPVNIIAASTGANFGFKAVFPHIIGATISYTLIVLVMGVGLNQILTIFPQFTAILKYLGATFLLYMSYKIATTASFEADDFIADNETKPPSFIEGMLSQGLNPKAWMVSMSGVGLFVLPNTPTYIYIMAFSVISFFFCFFGIGTWAAIGQLIGRFLSTKKRQISFNVFMGLLLASTVVSILMSS